MRIFKQSTMQNQTNSLVSINSDETLFYPFTVSFDKCDGSYNDPYVRVCVPNKVKNKNVKVFNLISWIHETRFSVQHESFECKRGLIESACDSKWK